MHRSYIVKSSGVLNGPSPKVPRSRGAARFLASAVGCGCCPLGGSTMMRVCLKARRAKSLRKVPMEESPSDRATPAAMDF
jgi:hypothetical protein